MDGGLPPCEDRLEPIERGSIEEDWAARQVGQQATLAARIEAGQDNKHERRAGISVEAKAARDRGGARRPWLAVGPVLAAVRRRTGRAWGSKMVIASGLQPGETVVTDGQLRIFPGAPIVAVDAAKLGTGPL